MIVGNMVLKDLSWIENLNTFFKLFFDNAPLMAFMLKIIWKNIPKFFISLNTALLTSFTK